MIERSISIDSPVFALLRTELDRHLTETLTSMVETGGCEAGVSAKISISLDRCVDKVSGEVMFIPHIGFKCTSALKLEAKSDGEAATLGDEMWFCPVTNRWELRQVPSDQVSMWGRDDDEG